MKILCKTIKDGTDLFSVDFLVPPVVGDVIMRTGGEELPRVVQRFRVVERGWMFSKEDEAAALFVFVEPHNG